MKLTRKMTALFAVLCMTLGLSMTAFAANGKIMFTDPETEVGQIVEVKGVVEVDASYGLEDITVNMTYDTAKLKFSTADEVNESEPGKITFSRIGIENPNRVEFLMYFEAIAEGSGAINISDCNVWTTTDEKVYPVLGYSTVTIAPGQVADEPTDEPVDEPVEEPTGETVIRISDKTEITLLNEISHITLPARYLATTIKVNGVEFPAWQDTIDTNRCILYAENSNGENALYQYDAKEGTYQRFEVPEVEEEEDNKDLGSFIHSLSNIFKENIDQVVLGVGIAFIIFIIIILVLGIKLYNRNAELDELYEEYGLYEEEEAKELATQKVEKIVQPAQPKVVKVIPVTKKEKEEFIEIKEETEDDVLIASEDDEDDEIEVEFFEEEPEVKKELEDFAAEQEEVKELPAEEDEEDYYDDDLDIEFEVDFIDLDD